MVRVVYDASAKTEGPSLNDCLYTGPPLHKKIFEILVRFRVYPIILAADIEKAFLMSQISEPDQDVLRFLWFKDVHAEVPELQILKFTRVVFGVAPSPYLLNATIAQHLEPFEITHQETVCKIRESIYVDDIIMGALTESKAFESYRNSKTIFAQGGYNLRKFISNSKALQKKIDATEQGNEHKSVDDSYTQSTLGRLTPVLKGEHKTLGVIWNVDADELVSNIEPIFQEALRTEPTKHNIASIVCKIFDPLGILSPVVIVFKIFFQELCLSKVTRDEILGEDLQKKWRDLLSGVKTEELLRVPRCYLPTVRTGVKLIGLCDTSIRAYAAVVYLQDQNQGCSFIASKTRVALAQAQTIPRLELLGALLLSRLMLSIKESLSSIVSE